MSDLNISEIKQEYDNLTEKLGDPELVSRWEEFQELARRRKTLEKIIETSSKLDSLKAQIEEAKQIISSQEDAQLSSLAEQELTTLLEKEQEVNRELKQILSSDQENAPRALILEIRAGTGGEEASLFAANLLDMYQKYTSSKGWKCRLLESSVTDIGGLREASLEIEGEGAWEKLRFEGGVHRVQRIPTTEKQGRIHTSTASVAVMPKAKKSSISLNPADLRIEIYNASGPGGQNVNKRKTAVRIVHIPTNTVVTSQASRNQQQNRDFAYAILESRLQQKKLEEEQSKSAQTRKAQIGTADRSEKIRTYNFPQDRITDHRVQKSWHNIENILQGVADEMFEETSSILAQEESS
ncbi:MAG: peptide chain release factor 1 [bacterium]|nr:peptide chain release factor 1 [bacterium]